MAIFFSFLNFPPFWSSKSRTWSSKGTRRFHEPSFGVPISAISVSVRVLDYSSGTTIEHSSIETLPCHEQSAGLIPCRIEEVWERTLNDAQLKHIPASHIPLVRFRVDYWISEKNFERRSIETLSWLELSAGFIPLRRLPACKQQWVLLRTESVSRVISANWARLRLEMSRKSF